MTRRDVLRTALIVTPLFCGALWLLWSRIQEPVVAGASSRTEQALADPRPLPVATSGMSAGPGHGGGAEAGEAQPRLSPLPLDLDQRDPRTLALLRLERAKRTLDSYRESTRYPPESTPIALHPDQIHPDAPIDRERALRKGGETQLRVSQDKVYLVGDESVRFEIGCATESGAPVRCQVPSAAVGMRPELPGAAEATPSPLPFHDDGQDGDPVAGDGNFSAVFTPARQGFALYEGPLRVLAQVTSGDEQGSVFFDVNYTPVPPARFTGRFREALEDGSLSLYAGIELKVPGRYVIAGRVDDASGAPFALVTFNDELPPGAKEIRLRVFGKLVRDQHPQQPFTLRDVDGFLLREDAHPDRALMPPLRGKVHVARAYPETAFSDAEWTSEERSRYLTELSLDVDRAEAEVDATAPKPH